MALSLEDSEVKRGVHDVVLATCWEPVLVRVVTMQHSIQLTTSDFKTWTASAGILHSCWKGWCAGSSCQTEQMPRIALWGFELNITLTAGH